jgi:hypothetical protein
MNLNKAEPMYPQAIIKVSFLKNIEHMVKIANKVNLVFNKRITQITEPRAAACCRPSTCWLSLHTKQKEGNLWKTSYKKVASSFHE